MHLKYLLLNLIRILICINNQLFLLKLQKSKNPMHSVHSNFTTNQVL